MIFCRRLQHLPRSKGIRSILFQNFHKLALEQHKEHPSALSENYELRTIDETDRRNHASKKNTPKTLARSLLTTVKGLSDVKEEVYGALDAWAAFELEFPIVPTRMALERLRQEKRWHKIIQVSKWMISKGVGKTHNTYALMLKAYCLDGRLEEAEELWDKLTSMHNRNMPKNMFAFMTNVYRKRELPEKVVEIFEQMEKLGIKPDRDMLKRAEEAYQQLNMEEKVKSLGSRYALDAKTRRKEKRLMARKAIQAAKPEKEKCGHGAEYETDEEVDVQEQGAALVQFKQIGASYTAEKAKSGHGAEYQTDDEVDVQEKGAALVQFKQIGASYTADGISNSSKVLKRDEKSEADLCADDKFVMQIISTM